MTRTRQHWTPDSIGRRRRLHAQIDVLAHTAPASAARLRLQLYTLSYEVESGALGGEALEERLTDLESDPAFAALAA
ncbi:hypothetical protein ACEXQE_06055 [Herbiconiux sp. P17]|uniref:hypothetical protein n=1 Tax=Herbiconiux wuyangfengii TaxID=3342794 RepID=UPI0035B8E183